MMSKALGEHVELRYYAAVDQVAAAVVEGLPTTRGCAGSPTDPCRSRPDGPVRHGSRPDPAAFDAWPPRRECNRLLRVHAAELAAEPETQIATADGGA